jgi:hypothetical protein
MNRLLLLAAFLIGTTIAIADTPAATHRQTRKLGATKATANQSVSHFCLNTAGDLVVCDDSDDIIRIITPRDQLKTAWKMPFEPHAIVARADGGYVVTGPAVAALLGPDGRILKQVELPVNAKYARSPGVAVIKDDIFICARAGTSFSVFRFNKQLGDCKEIVRGLRGCCGCQDIGTDGKELFVVENARHHVIRFDRDGNKLGEFGRRDPESLEGYGGCCEPKNICFGPGGAIYTSESNNFRIKRWSADGKCTLVGLIRPLSAGCVQVAIAVNKDGSEIYFMDRVGGTIHVLNGPALGR